LLTSERGIVGLTLKQFQVRYGEWAAKCNYSTKSASELYQAYDMQLLDVVHSGDFRQMYKLAEDIYFIRLFTIHENSLDEAWSQYQAERLG
jgi:hypothetical protein